MPRAARGRATRSTRSPATFSLNGHIIETYNHIDDLPQLSSAPKKRPRHATRGATAAERRADRQAAAASEPQPNGIVTRSSRQNLLRHSNSTSPLTAPSPSSEPTDNDYPPISCRVCFKSNTPTKIVCCSICRKGVHTFCLNPPVMDLPNDSSWKCSKCRRTRLPLKKEARIILRDALSTYSPLCTDNYINAVANVVCVVSDSESPHNKKNPNPRNNPKPDPPQKPSQPPPNDNTVVLRLSTDDSDLDSNVEDDIQPNPLPNSDKPHPGRPRNRSVSIRKRSSSIDPSTQTDKNSSPSKKNPPKVEHVPSPTTSVDGDDERPLSQLMSRGLQRRHRHARTHKPKQTDPTLASPKMRLKAKQRRIREENGAGLHLSSADLKTAREPVSLPPKRRGRKPGTKKVEKIPTEKPLYVSGNSEKDASAKNGDQKKQIEIEAQPASRTTTGPEQSTSMDVKTGPIKEEVIEPSPMTGNELNKETKGVLSDQSDESASSIDEGYPGDTEDDLPLSKRLARYRRPSSPQNNKELNKEDSLPTTSKGQALKESPPAAAPIPVSDECNQDPKQEAIFEETAAARDTHTNVRDPESLAIGGENPSTPIENPESILDLEKQSSGSWPQMKLDPKHEALFALARVQREQPKPVESSENHVISLESESPPGGTKASARPKNIPESERQRIEVTALAASNMRRNVSNMASTMAGLRPQSPRLSKGSINLLLQPNQPEAHSDIAAQRSYQSSRDINMTRHGGHQSREEVIHSASDPHLSQRDLTNPPQMYRDVDPRTQQTRRNSGTFAYRDPSVGTEIGPYPMHQSRNGQTATRGIAETDVSPFAKRNRSEEILPQAKRPRNNKSDISNVLVATDNLIPMKDRQIMNPDDRLPHLFPDVGRQTTQHPAASRSTVQVHSQDRQVQPNQISAPYSITHRAPQGHFGPPEHRPGNFGMRERLTLPEARMNRAAEGSLSARFPPTGTSYPNIPLRNPVAQAESGLQMNREEENRHATFRVYENAPIPPVQEPGIRSSQTYPSSSIGGESLPPRLQWPESNNSGANAPRQDFTGTSTTNQPWSDSRAGNAPQQESSYNAPVNRFVPIDRRTRRPMPYVPTATRKAQFEQGRALAFIDSRPVAPNADPSETYRMEDRSPGLSTRPYSTRPEGQYSGPEYTIPQSGHSRTTYGDEESRAQATSYHGDYYPHRQEYRRNSNHERTNEGVPYAADSQRDSLMRESIESNTRGVDGAAYGQSRLSMHQHGQSSSGAILEPPFERKKVLPLERKEVPPPFGSLVGSRVRSHRENEIPGIANAFQTDRRPPEIHARATMESARCERGYNTNRLQTRDHRSQGFNEVPYDSFHTRRNEALRAPAPIVDTRLPTPIHVEGDHYRSRETTVGPAGRRFSSSMIGPSSSGTLYGRQAGQVGNHYDYGRGTPETRGAGVPQNMAALDKRNEDFAADRVSNIPLVARFDNSLGGYMDGKPAASSSDRGSGMGDRPMMQRSKQGQQLPSLRSNPSLRDLLS